MKKPLLILALLLALLPVTAFGSGISTLAGGGASLSCVGGPPAYCAPTKTTAIVLRSAINYPAIDPNDGGPAVGVPFIDPNFGTQIVRVTDEATYYGSGTGVANTVSQTNSSAEAYSCSKFNPALASAGGYLCWFLSGGNGWEPFVLDATTMQIYQLPAKQPGYLATGEPNTSWTDPWVTFTSETADTVDARALSAVSGIYPATPQPDPFVGTTIGSAYPLFTANTTTCPNLPTGANGTLSELESDSSDTKFEGYTNNVVVYVDRTNPASPKCDWWDVNTAQVGGTDFAGVVSTTTWTTTGVTIHQSRLAPSGKYVVVAPETGTTNFLYWQTGPPVTAAVYDGAYSQAHNVPLNNWDSLQDGGDSYTGGKGYLGNMSCIEALAVTAFPVVNTLTNPGNCVGIGSPTYTAGGDTHPSAADEYTALNDMYPIIGSSKPFPMNTFVWNVGASSIGSEGTPNGTTIRWDGKNTTYNPDWSTMEPLNGELYGWSMDGSNKIWRFAHTRTSGYNWNSLTAPYYNAIGPPAGIGFAIAYGLCTETHDGNFAICTSNWDFSLGTHGYAGWQPYTAYTSGTSIINDSNGNLETAQSSFTSGAFMPVWSTTNTGLSNDGSTVGAWAMGNTASCPYHAACRWDVFAVRLK